MSTLTPIRLAESIRTVFMNQDNYQFDKYVPAFKINGKYVGDCFSIVIFETCGSEPPIIYHTFSPYDTISQKAPNQALVFRDGELLLNTDFGEYIRQRTGVM